MKTKVFHFWPHWGTVVHLPQDHNRLERWCFSTFPASLCGVTLSYEQQVALADNLSENSREYVPVLSIAPWVTSNHSILPVNTWSATTIQICSSGTYMALFCSSRSISNTWGLTCLLSIEWAVHHQRLSFVVVAWPFSCRPTHLVKFVPWGSSLFYHDVFISL